MIKTLWRKIPVIIFIWIMAGLIGELAVSAGEQQRKAKWAPHVQVVLDATKPLQFDRGGRLPLYLWHAMNPGLLDPETAQELVEQLNARGIGLVTSWNPKNRERSLEESLSIARAQKKLGLRVNVNATRCLYSFFDGNPRTAHVDDEGRPFWDTSFGKDKMGCPFAIDFRRPAIREQVEYFIRGFKQAELDVDFIFADWEIDGPIEFNEAHAASKRCRRCRQNIRNIDDFGEFQKVLRKLRCQLQREVYAEPVKHSFPDVLVGNYGVYPHNGLRYWYDYYEHYVDGQPFEGDQRAKYRTWYDEFPETGYTFAMPVVYPWRRIFDWYDYDETDYRWFYNMLLVASNAGKNTPAEVPVISFVHWHTIEPKDAVGTVTQLSEAKYQELLWHALLRGTDTFFLWCRTEEAAKESRLVHEVYAEAQQYGPFLSEGTPINFDVPKQPGTVISGLELDGRVLVRRTDFGSSPAGAVPLTVGGRSIEVPPASGRCQIISLR
jgi:hypothetical protein